MKNLIDLIHFDWSGTLSDDRRATHKSMVDMSIDYNLEPVYDFDKWLKQAKGSPQEYFGSKGVKETAKEIYRKYCIKFAEIALGDLHPTIYKEVHEVLSILKRKGIKLTVISAHPHKNLVNEAKKYDILQFFDEIVGSVTNKEAVIRGLNKKYAISKTHTAYIGDTINDVIAAKKAKVISIAVTRGYHSKELLLKYKPQFIWSDLNPVKKFVT